MAVACGALLLLYTVYSTDNWKWAKKGRLTFLAKEGQARSGAVRRGQARSGAFSATELKARPVPLSRRHGVAGGAEAVVAFEGDRGEADEEEVHADSPDRRRAPSWVARGECLRAEVVDGCGVARGRTAR